MFHDIDWWQNQRLDVICKHIDQEPKKTKTFNENALRESENYMEKIR